MFLSDPDLIIVSPCPELTDPIFLKRENVTLAAEDTNYYISITLVLNYGQIIEAAVWSRLKAEDFVEFLQAEDQFSYKLLIESSTHWVGSYAFCLLLVLNVTITILNSMYSEREREKGEFRCENFAKELRFVCISSNSLINCI